MRRTITLSVLLLLGALLHVCFAQKLQVESFQVSEGDLIARTSPRNDLNGKPCAVIRVGIGLTNVDFGGNLMGDPVYKPGEYLVYMPQGNTELTVRHANFVPLTVRFSDYGIGRLQSGCTYQLTILSGGNSQTAFPKVQGNFFMLNITPKQARISINGGDPVAANGDGVFKIFLKPGSYNYRVEADGYDPQSGHFEMADERIIMPVSLRSYKATVTIKTTTVGASIYVNEEFKGTSLWQGILNPGTYLLEARKEGCRPFKQAVTLSKREERSFSLPELQPIYGSLIVDYEPMDAEVYMDGKLLGKSPNLFSEVFAGTHEIKIVKGGYAPHTERITILENQQSSLSGKLTRGTGDGTFVSDADTFLSSGKEKETFEVNGVKFTMVRVEGGTFLMGATPEMERPSKDEKPTRRVTLSTFYMGETEVTQALWKAVTGNDIRVQRAKVNWVEARGEGDNYPMYYISWEECQQFITKLNQLTGRKFSLPTEAQWEFAARGGNKSKGTQYSGNRLIDVVAWYEGNSQRGTHPVGRKTPNELGLYDMAGNVSEWCYDPENKGGESGGLPSVLFTISSDRAARGGSWRSEPWSCRSSKRIFYHQFWRFSDTGLRLVLEK